MWKDLQITLLSNQFVLVMTNTNTSTMAYTCTQLIVPDRYYEACIYDVIATNLLQRGEDSIAAYSAACQEAGAHSDARVTSMFYSFILL